MAVLYTFSPNTLMESAKYNANNNAFESRITDLEDKTQYQSVSGSDTHFSSKVILPNLNTNSDGFMQEDSGGTERYLSYIDEDDIIKFGMFVRQGGDPTDWTVPGTTTYTNETANVMQMGVGVINTIGPGGNAYTTFPIAYNSKPLVMVFSQTGSSPTYVFWTDNISSSGFSTSIDTTPVSDQHFTWLAIGRLT